MAVGDATHGIVYKITSPSGKAYIGMTRQKLQQRLWQHNHSSSQCTLLRKAIRAYGWDAMHVRVVESNVPRAELAAREIACIKEHGTLAPRGYNATRGGDIGEAQQLASVNTARRASCKRRRETRFSDASPVVQEYIAWKAVSNAQKNAEYAARKLKDVPTRDPVNEVKQFYGDLPCIDEGVKREGRRTMEGQPSLSREEALRRGYVNQSNVYSAKRERDVDSLHPDEAAWIRWAAHRNAVYYAKLPRADPNALQRVVEMYGSKTPSIEPAVKLRGGKMYRARKGRERERSLSQAAAPSRAAPASG